MNSHFTISHLVCNASHARDVQHIYTYMPYQSQQIIEHHSQPIITTSTFKTPDRRTYTDAMSTNSRTPGPPYHYHYTTILAQPQFSGTRHWAPRPTSAMQTHTSTHQDTSQCTQICTHKSNPSQRAKKVPGGDDTHAAPTAGSTLTRAAPGLFTLCASMVVALMVLSRSKISEAAIAAPFSAQSFSPRIAARDRMA